MGEEKWSLSQEEEDLRRQTLFRKARKGDEHAKQELQKIYGVRFWSAQERAKLVYDTPKRGKGKPDRKSTTRSNFLPPGGPIVSEVLLRCRTWWLDCLINGQRFQRRLGKGISRSTAVQLSLKYRCEILSGNHGYGRKQKDLSFDEAWERFESWAVKEKRPLTVKTYKECLRRLAESFGGRRLGGISSLDVQKHKHARKEAGAMSRANREVACLRKMYNYCLETHIYEGRNPVDRTVKLFPGPRRKDRVLSREEEERLLAKCPEPLKTMLLVAIYTGLRMRSELLTLRWENVDLVRKTLTIMGAYAKNGKVRTVPLNSVVYDALSQHPHPPEAEWVFTTTSSIPYKSVRGFYNACKAADLTGLTPHWLRHTFASRLLENGVDPIMATKLAGWSSIKMLDRYAHADPSRMAEAVEGMIHYDIHSVSERRILKPA